MLGLLLAGGLLTAVAVRDALSAADAIQLARGELDGLDGRDLTDPASARPALDGAATALAQAEARLGSPAVAVVSRVPVLGRSWRAEAAVLELASSVVDGLDTALAVDPADLRTGAGSVDVAALQDTGERLRGPADRADRALGHLAAVRTGLTPPPVGRGVEQARTQLGPAAEALRKLAEGARVGASLLGGDGPRSVFVAIGNNAELRGTVGFVSSFATGELRDGSLELGPFRDTREVRDEVEAARTVPAPAAYVQDYGPYLGDTTDFRMWNMTPDAPTAAAVVAEITGLVAGVEPDVVLLLDVPAAVRMAELSGQDLELPDGRTVEGDEALEALLVDAYADAGDEQEARRNALTASAGVAATRLLTADVDLARAVRALAELGSGRHLAVWSARADEQQALVDLGVAGAVAAPQGTRTDDLCLVTVNNLSANKLDYYVDRTVQHEVRIGRDSASVVQSVRLVNRAPDGLVPYVVGRTTPGRSSLRVELSVPSAASISAFTVDGEPARGAVRTSPDRTRALTFVDLGQGEQVDVQLRYEVPLDDGRYALRVVPQALARDAELTVRAVEGDDGVDLRPADGFRAVDGGVVRTGPFERTEVLELAPARARGLFASVREFWREPVTLG